MKRTATRVSARLRKLEGAVPKCDGRVLRLTPAGHVPGDADRCRRFGGSHVRVIKVIVTVVEPQTESEVRS